VKNKNTKKYIVEFGQRKLHNNQFSTVISLPKQALKNCSSSNFYKVNIQLVVENGEKYLKLIPILNLQKTVS